MKFNKSSIYTKRNEVSSQPKENLKKSQEFHNIIYDIKEEINFLRTNLKEYINKLLYWKAFLKANKLNIPKKPTLLLKDSKTFDELINFLKLRLVYSGVLLKLESDEKLYNAAKDFIYLLQKYDGCPEFPNLMIDKNAFVSRLRKYANPVGLIGESVNIHDTDAEIIILKLLLGEDDPHKTDREIFLNKKMRYFGVATGTLLRTRSNITIIDFCEDFEKENNLQTPIPNNNFLTNNTANLKKVIYKLNYNDNYPEESFNITNQQKENIKSAEPKKNKSLAIDAYNTESDLDKRSFSKTRYRSLNISIENLSKATNFVDKVKKQSVSSIRSSNNTSVRVNTVNSNISMTNSKNSEETIVTNDTNSHLEKKVSFNNIKESDKINNISNEMFYKPNRIINKSNFIKEAHKDNFSLKKNELKSYK